MELIENIDKVHTTELGEIRIQKNLSLEKIDIVKYIKGLVLEPNAVIERKGKNYYVKIKNKIITINSYNYCIITAHKIKE